MEYFLIEIDGNKYIAPVDDTTSSIVFDIDTLTMPDAPFTITQYTENYNDTLAVLQSIRASLMNNAD